MGTIHIKSNRFEYSGKKPYTADIDHRFMRVFMSVPAKLMGEKRSFHLSFLRQLAPEARKKALDMLELPQYQATWQMWHEKFATFVHPTLGHWPAITDSKQILEDISLDIDTLWRVLIMRNGDRFVVPEFSEKAGYINRVTFEEYEAMTTKTVEHIVELTLKKIMRIKARPHLISRDTPK